MSKWRIYKQGIFQFQKSSWSQAVTNIMSIEHTKEVSINMIGKDCVLVNINNEMGKVNYMVKLEVIR